MKKTEVKDYLPLCKKAPSPELQLSVIVPAKNEEDNIIQTLQALYRQEDADGRPLPASLYEVIVLANNCHDHTALLARKFAETHPDFQLHIAELTLPAELAHIGFVRRMLMDEAGNRLKATGNSGGIIASTDADTLADTRWVYHIIKSIRQGADAVGGRILTSSGSYGPERSYHLQDVAYRYLHARLEDLIDPCPADPWPRHFQHFGPSLALTCSAYERVGRLPIQTSLEDVALVEALQRFDCRIRHNPDVKVYTSCRKSGRVGFGFSVQLQLWEDMSRQGVPLQVAGLEECLYRLQLRRRLRACWQSPSQHMHEILNIAEELGPEEEMLLEIISSHLHFGALYQHLLGLPEVRQQLALRFPSVNVSTALAGLRAFLRMHIKSSSQKDPADTFLPAGILSA